MDKQKKQLTERRLAEHKESNVIRNKVTRLLIREGKRGVVFIPDASPLPIGPDTLYKMFIFLK